MKKLRSSAGVTLVSLVVTIVIMLILTMSINMSMTTTIELKKYNAIKEDIIALTEEVKLYYLKNEKLPVYEEQTLSKLPIPNDALEHDVNPNDNGNYYYIDTSKFPNLDLNRGEGNKTKNFNTKDIYVVNEKSMTVYYLDGAVLDGKKHYTIVDDFVGGAFAEKYYSKADLPLISVVILESNGKDKTKATNGDNITLKILANYEFTKEPTVKINGNIVTTNWNGTIGQAEYIIPDDIELNNNVEITFSISDYEVGEKVGDEITNTTFGEKVYYYKNVSNK